MKAILWVMGLCGLWFSFVVEPFEESILWEIPAILPALWLVQNQSQVRSGNPITPWLFYEAGNVLGHVSFVGFDAYKDH